MEITAYFVVASFLYGPGMHKIFWSVSPFINFLISLILFIGIKKQLIFFQFELRFLFMGKNDEIAIVIWINLVRIWVIWNSCELLLTYLTTLLRKYTCWNVMGLDYAHYSSPRKDRVPKFKVINVLEEVLLGTNKQIG